MNIRILFAMKTTRSLALLLGCAALVNSPLLAATIGTDSAIYNVGATIPDNDLSGFAITETFTSGIRNITDLTINLTLSGGYNGDIYAYVTHDSGFSVLLNRSGVTSSDPFGYSDSGFNVTFNDVGQLGNIHDYQLIINPGGGVLVGSWRPDGRATSPLTALDTDPATAPLSSFDGLDPNGDWTVFLADVSPGGTSTLVSWGISVNGAVVPDGNSTFVLLLGASSGILALISRKRGA